MHVNSQKHLVIKSERVKHPPYTTDEEIVLTSRHILVSNTDLKGIITYANSDFQEVCGYSEEELIGKPHNIIRHPDMPRSAFLELWNTIQNGNTWTGVVKNRAKNGGYYWVLANVSPMFESGKIIGYISVRYKPDASLLEQAKKL
ncbi:MAG: PAS domain-containing protein, partial [Spirochaetia bacterium]|nr:PAS domain-containing protein [Spirochaetia bacterium]